MSQDQDNISTDKNIIKSELCAGAKLAKVVRLNRRFIDIQMKDLGLSRTQWMVLFCLKNIGDCTQKELLKNLDLDAGHLARVLEDLEIQKYIMRTPVAGNRRCLFIEVTKYGKEYLMPHIERVIAKEKSILFSQVSNDVQEHFLGLLDQAVANLEAVLKIDIIEEN